MLGCCLGAVTMSKADPPSATKELAEAREFLRKRQAQAAEGAPGFPYRRQESTTEEALAILREQRRFVPTNDPDIVRRGIFRFDRKPEEERIRRTEEFIRRVQPGPFEDPNYFALLAYQAASIEMALPQFQRQPQVKDPFSRIILGTVHGGEVNAFAQAFPRTGYTVVLVQSGLIDFVYQSAKAVVEAINPFRTPDKSALSTANMDMDRIRAELKVNEAPVNRVYRTLESYFFKGYPRAFANETVADEQVPFLGGLIWMAERWITAHEYGHGLALPIDFSKAPYNANQAEEYFADCAATTLTVASGWSLDHLPAEVSLAGANFALACLKTCRRAKSVVTRGKEVRDEGNGSHPPNELRALQNIASFRQFFDVQYDGGRVPEPTFVMRKKAPAQHGFGTEQSERAYFFSNVLFEMWPAVKERLTEQYRNKRQLHPMWG